MSIVLILGVTAQVLVEVIVERCEFTDPWIPFTIDRYDAFKGILAEVTEIVGLTVALVLVVSQLIVELQMSALPERLAVVGTEHIAAVVAGGGVVPGGEESGVVACLVLHLIQVHLVIGSIPVFVVTHTAFQTQGDIAPFWIQTSVELQHSPYVFVLAIAQTGTFVTVDDV